MDFVLNKRLTAILLYFVFFFCLLPVAIFSIKRPAYNWDMLAYMAVVIRMDHPDPQQIHQLTYAVAKENIPSSAYSNLTDSSSVYRRRMAESQSDFYQQLPFYLVKPFYTGIIYLLNKAGFTLISSTILPSVFAYFLIGMLLFHWLRKYFRPWTSFLAGLLLMYSMPLINLAGTSTPDCLSSFLLLAAIYFILEKPSLLFGFFLLILSGLCRIDNLLTASLIIGFLFFSGQWKPGISLPKFLLMMSVLILCYFSVTFWLAREFGWNLFYYPRFIRYYNLSYALQNSFSLKEYLKLSYSHAITALVSTHFTLFVFLALLVMVLPFPISKWNFDFDSQFCLLLICIMVLRFILYPNLDDRFYLSFYLAILVLLVRRMSGLVPGERQGTLHSSIKSKSPGS
jgi:hypothetical protein